MGKKHRGAEVIENGVPSKVDSIGPLGWSQVQKVEEWLGRDTGSVCLIENAT